MKANGTICITIGANGITNTIGANGITNGTIGKTLNDIGIRMVPLVNCERTQYQHTAKTPYLHPEQRDQHQFFEPQREKINNVDSDQV